MPKEKIIDYISGKQIISTPEEREATQPLSKELCKIFGYEKKDLITRPQFRIETPGKGAIYYPDIVVKENGKIKIICECKQKNNFEGKKQLEKYMNLTEADYGIWFNGKERLYIKKRFKNGKIWGYDDVASIPLKGRTSIDNFKKKDLKSYDNLINIFKEMHSYISVTEVGENTGIKIAENFIKILFCKIYDERYKKDNDLLSFYCSQDDTETIVANRIKKLFKEVKEKYDKVFSESDEIKFSEKTIFYVVRGLRFISLMKSSRDAIANAFEVFVGKALKGDRGQFFTPRNVIRFMLSIVWRYKKINHNIKIMDPACGTGGFIIEALKDVWDDFEKDNNDLKSLNIAKMNFAKNNIFGIDINSFVAKVTKAYMCIMGDGTSNVDNKNSLNDLDNHFEKIDLIITNPPFGKKIKIEKSSILEKYELSKMNNNGVKRISKTNPEILFIELCIKLLKKDGVMGIVLPEGIFVNHTANYIRKFILKHGEILAIISMPSETFQPNTGIKTSILIFRKTKNKSNEYIRFFDIKKIGHDKKGKVLYKYDKYGDIVRNDKGENIIDDELNDLLNKSLKKVLYNESAKLRTFIVPTLKVLNDDIWLYPKYYSNYLRKTEKYNFDEKKYNIFTIRELLDLNIIQKSSKSGLLPSGIGVESNLYDENGKIPFIRTSDLKNLEITRNPQKFISEEHYRKIKDKYDIKPYDILLAKDGNHLIGEAAMIMKGEENIVLQSHIYKIRVLKNKYGISAFNMMSALNKDETLDQIKSLVFVQGTIPTLSKHIYTIKLKFPKHKNDLQIISDEWRQILEIRYKLKNKIKVKW